MKSARIYTNDLNRLIAATKSFVSDSDHRPCNQYIKLEFHAADNQVVAMAVDGYRMSVEHSVISDCDEDFVAFIKSNTKLRNKQYATISLTEDGKAGGAAGDGRTTVLARWAAGRKSSATLEYPGPLLCKAHRGLQIRRELDSLPPPAGGRGGHQWDLICVISVLRIAGTKETRTRSLLSVEHTSRL